MIGALLLAASTWQIQDNSFFIEEAYNQDPRVVQHIFTVQRDRIYNGTFTQEWPAGGLKNQLSYSVGWGHGAADTLINYRYQLVGDADAKLAIAPRVSAILPTAHHHGIDVNLPVSYVLSDRFVTHWNAGATAIHGEKTVWSGGASVIWAARPLMHFMLENRWTSDERWVVSPGIRWAHNRPHDLQIVPGIAFPFSANHQKGVLLYLSFEHPF
jgi:hypothetical protein